MTDHENRAHGLSEREEYVYRLTEVNGLSQRVIAEKIGVSQRTVSEILSAARAKLPPVDLEAVRQKALALHEDVIRRAYELAEMKGAPVTSGKDGSVVYDPEDNSVVRDFAGRLAALQLALKADEQRRKLLGADAASKTEVTGSVRYEVVGMDPSDLT